MPEVKFEHVVTFSSEDASQKAENLIKTGAGKKWRSNTAGESQVSVVLQMSQPQTISSVDIGNNGSAFVEVQVGRKAGGNGFNVLLVASSFLTPQESRNEQNLSRVRMFAADKLNGEVAKQQWDQVKIICTQPFNKHIKYGLSFFSLHSKGVESKLGAFKLKEEEEEQDVGSLFSSARGQFKAALHKEKQSVAAELKSEATLASVALSEQEASRKRKALDDQSKTYLHQPKPIKDSKKLPKRRTFDLLEEPLKEAKVEKPVNNAKKMKIKPEKAKIKPEKDKIKPEKDKIKPEKKVVKKFNKLFEDVVFVMSGFQNPLRAELRQKALEMGGKYKGDWDNRDCTHLICAFANTPKFNQVKKVGGKKIVKQQWIEKCYSDKKRYPWRRYCLDPKDASGQESEDEIETETQPVKREDSYEQDTDDEIEQVKRLEKDTDDDEIEQVKKEDTTDDEVEQVKKEDTTDDEIEQVKKEDNTDDEEVIKAFEDDYDADTDVDDEKDDEKWPRLPECFAKTNFFLYGSFGHNNEAVRKSIVRGIVAANGTVKDYMSPDVHFVVTTVEWDENFNDALKVNPKVKFVRPSFVQESLKKSDKSGWEKHAVTK